MAAAFARDEWQRPEGGGGITRMLEDGELLERAGVGFSHVKGDQPPAVGIGASPGDRGPCLGGDGRVARFPSAQSVRADGAHERALLQWRADVWWFGGGMDLTPYYPASRRTARTSTAPTATR